MNTNPIQQCLAEVGNALTQRGDAWRIASLATVDSAGVPQVRKVVVRAVDVEACRVLVYTDRRSGKFSELTAQPLGSLLLWCAERQQQVRMQCRASLLRDVAAHWSQVSANHGLRDYATVMAPGATLEDELTMDLAQAEQNFCVLAFEVLSIDRLWLSREGHRRQRLSADGVQDICP